MWRPLDFAISILSLPVVIPTLVVCAIAIRATSPGPAIFRQTRVGLNEKTFACLKLRTMYLATGDRPSHETTVSAITPIGHRLRRLKIDELPQIWNIMRGDELRRPQALPAHPV